MKKILLLLCFLAYILNIQAQTLYGPTYMGGQDNNGSLIKFIPATNNLTVVKSFKGYATRPVSNFIQATDGKLYGMTSDGGSGNAPFGYGVIISYDPSTSTYTRLKNFNNTDGAKPNGSLVQANNGKLYGMTLYGGSTGLSGGNLGYGVIFSFDPSSSTYTKLKEFDGFNGAKPYGSLIQASDGKLYGMTRYSAGGEYGVIFSFDPSTSTYTKLHVFNGTNGANPIGSLVQANDGKLYGMTVSGGSSGYGVIFSFNPSTLTYTKLKDFDGTNGSGSSDLVQASDGKLYGTGGGGSSGYGVIFSFNPSTLTYTKLKDFVSPNGTYPGSLMKANNGKLYGMTAEGLTSSQNSGTIFSFDPSSSSYTKLKEFNGTDGGSSYGGLMQANDGKLYGMTTYGGGEGMGVIFSYNLSTSTYTKLTDLDASDGRNPSCALIQANDGKLYGMTDAGGSSPGGGVIFSYNPSTSVYTKLWDFDINNGRVPSGSLMQASNGKLYGTTFYGGATGAGVIFSFDPSTSTYTILKDFDFNNGGEEDPGQGLVQASNGKLYGTTQYGGATGGGVIFSFDPSTSVYTKLWDFDYPNGSQPSGGSMMQASNGKLYGMALGGTSGFGYGVIFSFDPVSSTYTKLKEFDNTIGARPHGSLIQANDGKLYGMTYAGGNGDYGVIFSFDPSTSIYTKLHDFDGTNGAKPLGSLMQASDGKLYGMTGSGGSNSKGVVFSFDPTTSMYTKLKDFDGTNGAGPLAFVEVSNIVSIAIGITAGANPTCTGQSITFTATPVNGGSSPSYQWKVNGNNVGTNSPTYTTNTLTNGQVVSCVMVSNAPNANPTTATSNTITMTVNAVVIPTITISQTSCVGNAVSFSSTITNGGTAPAYLWTFTGTGTATNTTGSNFTLNVAANGNQVQCRLTSNAACVNPVQVNSSPLIINCTTTGVSNIDDLEKFTIMPNPNNGLFTVKIKLNNQREVRFSVLNSLGRTVYESPLTRMNGTQTKQISVNSLPGVYFLKTEIGNQVIYKRIIIIKN